MDLAHFLICEEDEILVLESTREVERVADGKEYMESMK